MDQYCVVIKDVNPPSELRRVVLPSKEQEKMSEQLATQPPSLPLRSLGQEGSITERAEPALKRTEPERTLALAIEDVNQAAISEPEDALQSTPMPYPAIAIASQEIPVALITAKTLLLLTSGP